MGQKYGVVSRVRGSNKSTGVEARVRGSNKSTGAESREPGLNQEYGARGRIKSTGLDQEDVAETKVQG